MPHTQLLATCVQQQFTYFYIYSYGVKKIDIIHSKSQKYSYLLSCDDGEESALTVTEL